MISGKINSTRDHHGNISTSVGNWDHNRLLNRTIDDQHPISAITDLQEILDKKLDSETALPLIEEAVKNKAKGLYYDAMKELARKPYWYLTSEIDPVTKMGTKASIISGPYDLGQGGGGGGGGGVTTVTIKGVEWPAAIVAGGQAKIQVFWNSVIGEEKTPTGNGTLYLKINNKQVAVKSNQPQGIVEFDVSGLIVAGANSIQVQVMDSYGTTGVYVGNINGVTLELKSNFNYKSNFTGVINYTYIPYGDVEKTVHIIVDGIEYTTQVVRSTGEQQTVQIIGLSHGSHTLKVYFTAVIDATEVTSNELFYDLIYYKAGNTTPIIASEFRSYEQEQYIAFNIPYRVYEYGKNLFTVVLSVNGVDKDPITVNTDEQYWDFRSDEPGIFNLQIKCGTTSKDFTITVKESTIDVKPVAQDLALELGTQGRTNAEPIEKRSKWEDVAHGISSELTNFNWSSDGWLKDTAGNTVLRVTGDARVKIPYKVFENDFKNSGKTIELELATSTVRNYETVIMSCLDKNKSDFFESKVNLVETDVRKKGFSVKLDNKVFKEKVVELGKYQFFYNNGVWKYNDTEVNIAEYGVQLIEKKIDPEAKATDPYLLNGDSFTITYSLNARGFYLTPQIAVFKSQQTSLSTQYKEDDHVRLAFVVEKNSDNRIIWMYINGIASGAIQYPTDDSFRHLDPNAIEIGTNDATIDIYNIRVYDNNLTSKQVVNNWVADTQDAAVKAKRYYHNQNYNDKNQITIEAMKASCPDLPQIIWDIDPLPQYKGDKRKGNAYYTDYSDSSRNFTGINGDYNVQGTSSSVYPTKNIRLNMKKATEWYDDNGNTIKSFKIGEDDLGANYFTYKVDFASSEGANNVELTKLYNDASKKLGILNPAQIQDNHIRVGINGYPIIAFHRSADGADTFCTKANFNNDKANENVYGFADGDESWEITNNSADEGNFKKPALPDTFGNAFEIRFPDEDGYSDLTKLRPMTEWVVSTDPTQATGAALPEPIQYTYKHTVRAEDGSYSEIEVTMPSKDTYYTHDTAEYRKTKFRAELKNWFNVDSTIFYYIFTHLFLMIDSRAKNAFPTYFKSRQEGDGGDRWFWLPYDMDTAIGINNEGKLVFDYNLEDVDKQDGANVFNGQNSVMWCNVRETFDGEIGAMYAEMRKVGNLISFDDVEDRFTVHQGKWSENLFNEDAHNKYVVPLAKGDNYLEMLQGSKAEQRRWWLYNRFKYFDSKYLAGDAKADFIQFRAYAKSDVVITPYADIYACVSYANTAGAVVSKRAERGKSYVMENPLPASASDQETYIYSASQLKSIGDLSGFFPDTVKVGNAVKLQELKVGDAATTYENTHLTELTLGSNTLLRTLDVRNCSALTKAIDVSGCTNIEEIYFDGTKITGINLPDGGILKKLHLPNTITKLTLKNQPLLNDLVLAGIENIESLWLENIPSTAIDSYAYVMEMPTGSRVRLIGIDNLFESDTEVEAFYNKLDVMHGLDGNGDYVERAQVTGVIRVASAMSYARYFELQNRYPEVTLIPAQIICTATFWKYKDIPGSDELEVHATISTVINSKLPYSPEIPERVPSISTVYTFTNWYIQNGEQKQIFDPDKDAVLSDISVKPDYSTRVRQYTVKFDPHTGIETIKVEPKEMTVDYLATIPAPTVTGIPEGLELLDWHPENSDIPWVFAPAENATPVTSDVTLLAHWNDQVGPTITIAVLTCNKYRATCTDDIGVTGYAITHSADVPSESEWIAVNPPQLVFTTDQAITTAEDYYFWAKDNFSIFSRTSHVVINGIGINKVLGTGVNSIDVLYKNPEGQYEVVDTSAVFKNSVIKLSGTIDSHYKDLVLKINGVLVDPDTEYLISESVTIEATCTPKTYTVTFDTFEKGVTPDSQYIVYKNLISEPAPQYDEGCIIEGWYTTNTFEAGTRWNFNVDTVERDMTLYANWTAYRGATKINITIPADNYPIEVTYTQSATQGVLVDWGDNTVPASSTIAGLKQRVTIAHTYEKAGNYIISFACNTGRYLFGYNIEHSAIMPTSVITNIDFSWDVAYTNIFAFNEASIETLVLTDYMSKVAEGCFYNCEKLTSISIPQNIYVIEQDAFHNCANLVGEITLPRRLTEIGSSAFRGCEKLTKINIPNTTSAIGEYAFADCKALTGLEIPQALTTISNGLLCGCSQITSLLVPENIVKLGTTCFAACDNLSKVILYNKHLETKGLCFNDCKLLKTAGPIGGGFNIEFAWETEIPANAFECGWDQSFLLSVLLPNTIKTIGDSAFYSCTVLEDINNDSNGVGLLPTELEYIGKLAFALCTKLTKIDIPDTVQFIGRQAFYDCFALTRIDLRTASVKDASKPTFPAESWFYFSTRKPQALHIPAVLSDETLVRIAYGQYWNYYDDTTRINYTADL